MTTTLLVETPERPGDEFDALTIQGHAFRIRTPAGSRTAVVCQCDCGQVTVVRMNNLRRGIVQSCGCLSRRETAERNRSRSLGQPHRRRLQNIWRNMIRRCIDPRQPAYRYYGAVGVRVCAAWLADFEAFQAWAMANGYAENLTLDRRENSLGYGPDNCRWATWEEQENNRSNNVRVTLWGETKTTSQWSRDSRCPVNAGTVRGRIRRGIPPELALTMPVA